MAEFKCRTTEQQQQLWLGIAELAMRRWNLPPQEMSWLGFGSNVVVKARAAGGDYVLRLHPPGGVKATWLRSEMQWLYSIRRNTDLPAPFPVATLVDGREQLFLELHHSTLPPPHKVYAAVFQFLEGEVKSARALSPEDVYRIGEYLGKLHTIAQIKVPVEFDRPRLNWEGLFGDDSPYASPTENELVSVEQSAVFDEVAERLRQPLSNLAYKSGSAGLIHADLLAKNVIFREDTVAALDFEYCGWGFFLYDLAPLLWQLKGDRATDYPALEDMVWRGYTSIRPAADSYRELLEPLIAARQLASCRWLMANLQNPTLREIAPSLIAKRCDELAVFLETGILRRSTPTL